MPAQPSATVERASTCVCSQFPVRAGVSQSLWLKRRPTTPPAWPPPGGGGGPQQPWKPCSPGGGMVGRPRSPPLDPREPLYQNQMFPRRGEGPGRAALGGSGGAAFRMGGWGCRAQAPSPGFPPPPSSSPHPQASRLQGGLATSQRSFPGAESAPGRPVARSHCSAPLGAGPWVTGSGVLARAREGCPRAEAPRDGAGGPHKWQVSQSPQPEPPLLVRPSIRLQRSPGHGSSAPVHRALPSALHTCNNLPPPRAAPSSRGVLPRVSQPGTCCAPSGGKAPSPPWGRSLPPEGSLCAGTA